MFQRIHIFGASGSGATMLGKALSAELQIPHLDTDSYYWKQTDPPFIEKNDPADRIHMIKQEIAGLDSWVLSGSICSWGDPLLEYFTMAVFLYLEPSVRMTRLIEREYIRFGDRIRPGGEIHSQHLEFISWAESYDTAVAPIRSLDLHEKWMKRLSCPIHKLDSNQPVSALVHEVTTRAVV